MKDMRIRRRMLIVFGGAVLASAAANAIKPTRRLADQMGKLDLETAIPGEFGEWRLDRQAPPLVENPQQEELIQKLYSQTLSRTYRHADGYRIMLAIAYGGDQRKGGLRAHYPDYCYPAQGFRVEERDVTEIPLPGGKMPVTRIATTRGSERTEPVTYWVVVGDQQVSSGASLTLAELRYTLRGIIPDGILFRVSSIDPDTRHAYERQREFAADLMASTTPEARTRLTGF